MNITPAYAAILSLVLFFLSVRTLRLRRLLQIPIGDGGNEQMLRAIRVQANFVEYVPLSMLIIFMLELQGAHYAVVNGLCTCLLVGRLSHAYGVSQITENFRFRVIGMALTFVALGGASLRLVVSQASHLFA